MSEEYTSRVQETGTVDESDWITRAQPGVNLRYEAPRWVWDVAYNLDYRHYARRSLKDQYLHVAKLTGKVEAIKNLLFFDLSDSYQLASLDIARNAAEESLTADQEKQNAARVLAYFLLRPSEKIEVKTGYRFIDTRYFGNNGIDKSEQGAFLDATYLLSAKLNLLAGYSYGYNATAINDISRHDAYGGFRYEYGDKSMFYGQVGNTWQEFKPGSRVSDLSWLAGISHVFPLASASVESTVKSTENPLTVSTREVTHSAKVEGNLPRGTISGSVAHTQYYFSDTGELDRKKAGATGAFRHELGDGLFGSLTGTAERFSRKTAAEYPYRFVIIPALTTTLNYGITASLTYTYVTYRYDLDDATGNKEIHRAVVELKKVF